MTHFVFFSGSHFHVAPEVCEPHAVYGPCIAYRLLLIYSVDDGTITTNQF
jgi:hypothetical protein